MFLLLRHGGDGDGNEKEEEEGYTCGWLLPFFLSILYTKYNHPQQWWHGANDYDMNGL